MSTESVLLTLERDHRIVVARNAELEAFVRRVAHSDFTGGAPTYVKEAWKLLRSPASGGTEA